MTSGPAPESLSLLPSIPDAQLHSLKGFVLDAVNSPHSRRAYGRALDHFLGWYEVNAPGILTKAVVQRYRHDLEAGGLSASTINVRLAAIRKLASEASDNGLLAPEFAAGITRVKGAKRHGVRTGNWLDREQTERLLAAPDPHTVKGKRDRAILSVLVGCGLRRSEVVHLSVDDMQKRDGRWLFSDLAGKGKRIRTVPVPVWVKSAIDSWMDAGLIREGRLFRAVNKGGAVWGSSMSEKVVWSVVEEYASGIGSCKLAPHDLRRTCAKLCRSAGGDLEQIQFLLGHASIQTTERYLGSRQNLTHAVNDDMGLLPVR